MKVSTETTEETSSMSTAENLNAVDEPDLEEPDEFIDDINQLNDPNFDFPLEMSIPKCDANDYDFHKSCVEVYEQIKDKFCNSDSMEEKFQLTLLPKSWSHPKIMSEFNISDRQARKVKNVVAENGILSLPRKKNRKKNFDRNCNSS